MRRPVLGVALLGALLAFVLGADAQEAPRAPDPTHRYELVGEREAVLDRLTGRIYVLRGQPREGAGVVTCIDPIAGTSVSKAMPLREEQAPAGRGATPWPARDGLTGSPRFVLPRQRGNSITVFDAATGRLHVYDEPAVYTYDLVEGTAVKRTAQVTDEGGALRPVQMEGNERAAIGALKTISTSQTLFREADKEGDDVLDYGTLQELSAATLIDQVLGAGKKHGYVFRTAPSTTTPEFLWWATASPEQPGTTGSRYFATNHAGVIYYSTDRPFTLDPSTCSIPEGSKPIGR